MFTEYVFEILLKMYFANVYYEQQQSKSQKVTYFEHREEKPYIFISENIYLFSF